MITSTMAYVLLVVSCRYFALDYSFLHLDLFLRAIIVINDTNAMHISIQVLAFVTVAVGLCLQAMTVLLVIFELTFIDISIGMNKAPLAMLLASIELANILGSVVVDIVAIAMFLVVLKNAIVEAPVSKV